MLKTETEFHVKPKLSEERKAFYDRLNRKNTAPLWEVLGERDQLLRYPWPKYDPALAKEDEITYAVQINGKLRSHVAVAAESPESVVRERVLADDKVKAAVEGKQIAKVIVVPGKLVNVVVK